MASEVTSETETATPASPSRSGNILNTVMNPSRRGSSHRTEFIAGLTTFVTMAYIIFVNTDIMVGTKEHPTGLDPKALIIGTIFAAIVPTLFMGIWADLPWALAPGLGYNALFAYTVVGQRGIPAPIALALVFLDGLAFLLIVIGPWRNSIMKGIPLAIKLAAGAGIGLFIAYIGFNNATLIDFSSGLPALSRLNNPAALIALAGILITALLLAWRVRAALLIGIIVTAGIAWATALIDPSTRTALLGATPNPTASLNSFIALPDLGYFWQHKGALDFAGLFGSGAGHIASGAIILFFLTFLVTDMMD